DVFSSVAAVGHDVGRKTFKGYEPSICANDWILAESRTARNVSVLDADEHRLLGHDARCTDEKKKYVNKFLRGHIQIRCNCRGGPLWPPRCGIQCWGGHRGPPLQLMQAG